MSNKNNVYWRICNAAAILLSVLSFTSLVIPQGVYKPLLWGIPYTLWTGILVTVVLVLLTYIATRVHPGANQKKK
jgi:hypothetical protein